jgi:thiamine biosynthesis lipoprotein
MITFTFEAIGTHWTVDIDKELSSEEEALLRRKIMGRIAEFDFAYSRFRDDSIVSQMARKAGEYRLPKDADAMIALYKKMYDITGGLVTPLIGKVLADAGYDASYSLVEKEMSRPKKWDGVLEWKDPILSVKEPALLDFGAGGKGYLVDIVSEILEENRIHSYCVDAGGDMRQRGKDFLKVGLEHPHLPAQAGDVPMVIGTIEIKNESLCGSAGNRRKWGRFHHVISPETLSSPQDLLAVWTVAKTTLLADLLTTALFFVPPETLLEHFEFEYLIVRPDLSIERSENFNAELLT